MHAPPALKAASDFLKRLLFFSNKRNENGEFVATLIGVHGRAIRMEEIVQITLNRETILPTVWQF